MWVLFVSALIFVVYAIASLVVPVHMKMRTKIICALIIFLFGLKYFVYSQTGGVLEPRLSPTNIVILEATYSALMLAVFLAIIKCCFNHWRMGNPVPIQDPSCIYLPSSSRGFSSRA